VDPDADYISSIYVNEDYICFARFDKGMDIYSYDISQIPISPTPSESTTPNNGGGNSKIFLWIGIGTTTGLLAAIVPVVIVMTRKTYVRKREQLKRDAISTFYSCYYCGYPINKDTVICEDCGKDIIRCVVCKLPVSLGENIGQCSLCQTQGHLKHMQEWISNKKKCPYCLQEIPIESIIPLLANEELTKKKEEE